MTQPVLEIKNLRVEYETRRGIIKAANDVSMKLYPGERLGLVGESGSGKSTTSLSVMRMIKEPGRIVGGEIILNGETDILKLTPQQMRNVRLARIAMIPQGAMNSLNPVTKVKDQLLLTMATHGRVGSAKVTRKEIDELFDSVGLQPSVADLYPHELSGGMKQRVCIAIAISMKPDVIIADEPTSALDVVVQRRIMQTLKRLQEQLNAGVILVGHDMGLMAQFVDRLGVMYGGNLVEVGTVDEIFGNPQHPYTKLLISSIPSLERKGEFQTIPGQPISLLEPPTGCQFHPRCPQAMSHCSTVVPKRVAPEEGRTVSCLLYETEEMTDNANTSSS